MSATPTSINPSQAVERIREIIVGRQLERLEQRIVRLENEHDPTASTRAATSGQSDREWEDRLCTNEARLEALQHAIKKLSQSTAEESQRMSHLQREEIQRLASQIQQVAALKAAEAGNTAVSRLEGRIGSWLGTWQSSLQNHLNEREERLAKQLRGEVAALWESTESQLTRLQSRAVEREHIEGRFARIAAAARALADCVSPPPFETVAPGASSQPSSHAPPETAAPSGTPNPTP